MATQPPPSLPAQQPQCLTTTPGEQLKCTHTRHCSHLVFKERKQTEDGAMAGASAHGGGRMGEVAAEHWVQCSPHQLIISRSPHSRKVLILIAGLPLDCCYSPRKRSTTLRHLFACSACFKLSFHCFPFLYL